MLHDVLHLTYLQIHTFKFSISSRHFYFSNSFYNYFHFSFYTHIKSSIVIIFKLWFLSKFHNSGVLAIVPSSFIISHITPAGFNPASLAKSTAASVCPALFNTPPSLATKGNTCPGLLKSSGLALLSITLK